MVVESRTAVNEFQFRLSLFLGKEPWLKGQSQHRQFATEVGTV